MPDRQGYQTHSGDTLCAPCYLELWGPRASHALSRATERLRPQARRSKKRLPWLVPGPTSELDPEEPIRQRQRARRERTAD